MTDILNWNEHPNGLLTSQGGEHQYTAALFGEYGLGRSPWFLIRNDGWFARITNSARCKDIAELCERDPKNLAWLMNAPKKGRVDA